MNKVYHRNTPAYGRTTAIVLKDGYAYVMVSVMNDSPEVAIIHDLCVHKDKRGEGLGRMLLEEAEKEAGEMGAKTIRLSTEPGSWLEEWYMRHGYRQLGVKEIDQAGLNMILEKEI